MRFLLIFLLLAPQLAAAGVTMCVDPQTGKKTFTDRACDEGAAVETMRIQSTNTTSGARMAPGGGNQTWNSDRDETRSGRDYRQDERVRSGSVSADGSFNRSGYLGTGY